MGKAAMKTTNTLRAMWAAEALHGLANRTGADIPDDAVTDLIANIGHFCDAAGIDFLQLTARAIGHWKREQTDPESIEPAPYVTIEVAPC